MLTGQWPGRPTVKYDRRMELPTIAWLAALLAGSTTALATPAQQATPPAIAAVSSGTLHLKGLIWAPAGTGPFPAVLFNHGRGDGPQQQTSTLTITAAANVLGPVFAKHGYVFLYLFRRGEGLSADQGSFIGELLDRAEIAGGAQARMHQQYQLLTTDHLQDGLAGLQYLKSLRMVDANRVAVAGHSFGGQITLLEAERDPTVRAVITFGAAANSWNKSAEIRSSMLSTIGAVAAPVLIMHAANDYSTAPGLALAEERARLSKPCVLKIYPPVGRSASAGHNFIYSDVGLWEDDVFRFLDEHLKAH